MFITFIKKSYISNIRVLHLIPNAVFLMLVAAQSEAQTSLDDGFEPGIEMVTVVGKATNSVVTTQDIETYQANDLADVFRLIPSISVGGSVGIAQKIYLRGLEDSLINVTVDGAPQTSTLFHHIGRVTIDPNLLKEVEVQAGAGEATSGAGAIGGAIRFETKDAKDLLIADKSFGGSLKANSFSNDGSQYTASLYGVVNDDWGVLGYFNDIDRDNMEDGNGDKVFGTASEQTMALIKLNGEFGNNQALSLSYERRDEEGAFSARPNWIVQADDILYPSEAERETVVANYQLNQSDLLNLEFTGYQTDSSFRGGRFDFLAEINTLGFDLRNTSSIEQHRITYGVDYRSDQVDSGYAIPQPEEDHREEGSVFGIYTQAHSQVTESLLLSYGARYDDYQYQQRILLRDYYGDPITDEPAETDSSGISLNAGLEYSVNDVWTFGLGYAEAMRGKEIGDGFTIDAYLYDRTDASLIAPNFEAETVSNIEASLEYVKDNFNAKLAVFHTEIDDAIFERLYGNSLFQNIGTVETTGFELGMTYRWDNIEVSVGLASDDSELNPVDGLYSIDFGSVPLNGYEFNGLGNSRSDTWNIGLNFTPTAEVTLGLNYTYVSQLTIDALHQDFDLGWVSELYSLNKPSYNILDIFAEWQASDNLSFNLAVTNAFDELYRDHSSVGDFSAVSGYELVVGPWEAGRDVRLSVSFTF